MSTYKLVLLPGDGIGAEVMEQAIKILETLCERYNLDFELFKRQCGFEYQQKTGLVWEEGTFELCRDTADAILLGAIGRMDNSQPLPIGEKSPGATIVLGLRSHLELYANVRPVMLFPNVQHRLSGVFKKVWAPENVNMVIIRENTEGFYFSQEKQTATKLNNQVIDERIITRSGAERVIKFAFNLARTRQGAPIDGTPRVTCVDKSNVLDGCRLFRSIFNSVASENSEIEADHIFVDAFTQAVLQTPEHFDVVVTTNLFGDIITDLSAVLQGGLGMAPSANLGDHYGLFEPVHGSAPDIVGKNLANPIGMILSMQMMLQWLADKKNDPTLGQSAINLLHAVKNYLTAGTSLPYDIGGDAGTSTITEKIIDHLKKQ